MRSKTDRQTDIFSPRMKLADLLDANYRLLGILRRVGIGFGFGDATVEEVCCRYGVNVNTFLLICNVYTFNGYRPGADMLRGADLRDIVRYLHSSHGYYMDVAVKGLEDAIDKTIRCCDDKRKSVIWKFFSDYKDELARHFDYEEKTVFPYIEAVLSHSAHENFTIGQYEKNHSNVEEKLDDLKSLVMRYLPRECSDEDIFNVLMFICILGEDLEKHTFIEDEILVPMVNALEGNEGKD